MQRLLGPAVAAGADVADDAGQLGEIFCLLGGYGGEFGCLYLATHSLTEAIDRRKPA